ncbi:oxalate/formate antiport family MFS transporter [Bacillus cereus]|uniref:OFA family MFS transporter n=1 Tax=Bacillus paramycoides TaxID=2026194 RepID=A0ABU6MZG9_9BACI|nr:MULTISPECIES: OFA family MFS transporter [Bacillus cereus group]PFD37857.1 oxalate/formate antiport family MFS transporter [Bacillus cereus]MED0973148.1 OFA family MFS transporter [Bacillus paramycoides]MED1090770.1 OFA family MFS transporter [Bacillus paramycoides]MED1107282.1 OFA family MFS transporter [Bacillus paramycoides]MED1114958.1 OFA family MFS transporter [Bacillus paramycoides]
MKKSSVNPWLVVLGTVIVQMGLGTIYTWSLFNQPLVSKYGWSLNAVAITFSITSLSLAFSTLFASKLQEKWGLRKLIMIAGLALGLGLILSSQASSLILLYVLAGVVVGYADGTAYITSLSNLIKWFPERKGLIAGISVSAYGSGSLIFKYINAQLIESVGVSQAFIYWGLIVTAMIVIGACLIHQAADQRAVHETKTQEYTTKEMLGTKEVYLLFIMLFTSCMSGLYLIGMVKDIGVQLVGLSATTAANAVAMVAIFNTLGRIILGPLSDKIGRLKIVTGTFVAMATSVLVLSFVDLNYGIYFVCVASVAFCFGGNITIFPAIVGDFFGMKNHSKNYGIVYQGFGFGALAGSFIGAILGGFKPTFMVIGVLCVVSFIIAILIQAPNEKKEKEEYRSVA